MSNIPKTSVALLRAISESSESTRWHDFYDRYHPMMEGYLRAVFPSLEAEEVIEDTIIALVQKVLPNYHYVPDSGKHFHNYLTGVLKIKAIEALKKRKREADKREAYKAERNNAPDSVRIMEEVEAREWRQNAYETAMQQIMADPKIKEQNKEIFNRVALKGEPPEIVAEAFGVTRNNVDQIKARMIQKIRELTSSLLMEEGVK